MNDAFLRFYRTALTLLRITVAVTVTLTLLAIPYRAMRDARSKASPTYHLTEISLPGYESSDAMAVSEQGEVVVGMAWNGSSCDANFQPFLVRKGTTQALQLPAHFVSAIPFGCNERGEVVGTALRDDETVWGILWKDNGQSVMVLRSKDEHTTLNAINPAGTFVGMLHNQGDPTLSRAFQIQDKKVTLLGSFFATSLNAKGDVAGWQPSDNSARAVRYHQGNVESLPTPPGYVGAGAYALTDSGIAGGIAITAGNQIRPCLWQAGKPTILEDTWGGVTSINNRGQAVGVVEDAKYTLAAALWEKGKRVGLTEQIDADWHLYIARGINESGQIVGLGGKRAEKKTRGYLLTPNK